jgi:hypothetical protein
MIHKRVGLKIKNKYQVKKIAKLIADKELDYNEIIKQIHDDYEKQMIESMDKTSSSTGKLVRVRQSNDIDKVEVERDILKMRKDLRHQRERIEKLENETPKSIDRILIKKYKINPKKSDDDF